MKRSLYLIIIAGLSLPFISIAQSAAVDEAAALRLQNTDLQKQNSELREENQLLRRLLSSKLNVESQPKVSPATTTSESVAQPTTAQQPANQQQTLQPSTSQPNQQSTGYWMSSSGKRHNEHCRYYKTSKGRPCGANDGIPCKICGG